MDLKKTLGSRWEEAAVHAGFAKRRAGVYSRAVRDWYIDASVELSGRNPVSMFGSLNLRHPAIDKLIYSALRGKYPQVSREAPVCVRPISGLSIAAVDSTSVPDQVETEVRNWWREAKAIEVELENLASDARALTHVLLVGNHALTYSSGIVFLLHVASDPSSAWRSLVEREESSPMNETFFVWCAENREQVERAAKAVFG